MRLLLLFHLLALGEAYKIVVFSPTISRSHMISNGRVADALAKDGHDVTLLEVEYDVSPDAVVSAHHARRMPIYGPFGAEAGGKDFTMIANAAFSKGNAFMKLVQNHYFLRMFQGKLTASCEQFIQRRDIVERLRAEKFDVYIGEQLTSCGTAYSHLLGIPTHIWLSSSTLMEHMSSILGVPLPTSYVPAVVEVDVSDRMTYLERLTNFAFATQTQYGFQQADKMITQIFRKHYGNDFPNVEDIAKESPLVLVAVDEFADFPRPTLHNVVYIGGLGIKEAESHNMTEPFISEMEKGRKGVVLFSLGSAMTTRHLPQGFRQNLLESFADLSDYHFIVKIDKDDEETAKMAANISNVYTSTWTPQPQILAHPRIQAFITHGGYNSLMESARHAVPLMLMGFFAEQRRNSRLVERNGWGIPFEKRILLDSKDEFKEGLNKILQEKSYKENALRLRKLVLNKPFSAEERLIKWFRFLEANGGRLPELMSEGRNLSVIAFYNLDIYIPLIALFFSIVYVAYRISRRVIHFVFYEIGGKKTSTAKKVQ